MSTWLAHDFLPKGNHTVRSMNIPLGQAAFVLFFIWKGLAALNGTDVIYVSACIRYRDVSVLKEMNARDQISY